MTNIYLKDLDRNTKIGVTLGPSTDRREIIEKFFELNVDLFRVNLAHCTEDELKLRLKFLNEISKEKKKDYLLVFDLPGPQVRIRNVPNPIEVKEGEKIFLTPNKEIAKPEEKIFYVDYPNILLDVKEGDTVLIDDGKIVAKVERIDFDKNLIECLILDGGIIKEGRKVVIENKDWSLPPLTKKDLDLIRLVKKYAKEGAFALSFVKEKEDLKKLKEFVGDDYIIIPKIETVSAIQNYEEIVRESDIIFIARGDLGVSLPFSKLPFLQRRLIRQAHRLKRSVIVATEILTSMIENTRPTRAEVDEIEKLILDGADMICVTNETAIGKHPARVVEVLRNVIVEVEKNSDLKYQEEIFDRLDKISYHLAEIQKDFFNDRILVITNDLETLVSLAKFRPREIYLVTSNYRLFKIAHTIYGVSAMHTELSKDILKNINKFVEKLEKELGIGNKVVELVDLKTFGVRNENRFLILV